MHFKPNEMELIQRLKSKQSDALADICDLYEGVLVKEINSIVRQPDVAGDLAQECFLKLWNRADQLSEGAESLEACILAIGRNTALDYLKTSK